MEKQKYVEKAEIFKVLSDSNRLQIIDMLSCGEMCVCKILEKFNITQPTLSHHLKVLSDTGILLQRKEIPNLSCRVRLLCTCAVN